jgi:hypothetical protein
MSSFIQANFNYWWAIVPIGMFVFVYSLAWFSRWEFRHSLIPAKQPQAR